MNHATIPPPPSPRLCFFFNDTATTEIYTLSLHDALPISGPRPPGKRGGRRPPGWSSCGARRSEEHTSELQSQSNLVCRLLLEKNKNPPQVTRFSPARSAPRSPIGPPGWG